MFALIKLLTKNLVIAIPVMMLAGFFYGLNVDSAWLKQLIVPLTFLMVYPMMVSLNIRKVFEGGGLRTQLLTQVINFAIIPFLAFGLGRVFFPQQPYLSLGLLLAALVPTSGMTISWTGLAGGNLVAAVKMTVIGLVLGSLATPFYVQQLLGTVVSVNLGGILTQIGLMVFLPMAAGYVTRSHLIRRHGEALFKKEWGPQFPPFSVLGVLGIVFIALALKAESIAAQPQQLLNILPPLALLYLFNYTLSTLIGRLLLKRPDAIAMVYGTVMRNLSIALAIAINAFGEVGSDAALVISLAYIIQVKSAAWYVKLNDRIFGPNLDLKTEPRHTWSSADR